MVVSSPRITRGARAPHTPPHPRSHDAVVPFLDKGKALRITGHSVGGAAATALAYRLAKAGGSLAEQIDSAVTRVVVERRDPRVTHAILDAGGQLARAGRFGGYSRGG
jgi:hypothetical protein